MSPCAPRRVARRIRVVLALCAGGGASMAAQAPQAPPPVGSPGSELEVYVMTMGPGDQIWERFGHNALGIRDKVTGTDVVYNWGVFRWNDADFLPRFIKGSMRYSVEAYDAALTLNAYIQSNRSVAVQELNLTPQQKLAIRDFVEWNVLEANKYYQYDYFGDNCSTRVRDALNKALGGALRQRFGAEKSGRSFRYDARRLTEHDVLYTGIDIGLGSPADREMTRWEAEFIPMTLANDLRELRATDGGPLVSAERVLFEASRPTELARPPNHQLRYLLIGLAIAAAIVALGSGGAARALATSWSLVATLLGVLLIILWGFTQHTWAYKNVNLLYFHPLWLLVALWCAKKAPLSPNARRIVIAFAVLTAIGVCFGLLKWPQANEQVALLALAPHAAVMAHLLRRRA